MNHKKQNDIRRPSKYIAMKGFAVLLLALGIFTLLFSACNSPKDITEKPKTKKQIRIERRSAKNWHKSYRLDKETNAGLCAQTYNPHDSINERIVYTPGETVTTTDTVSGDTLAINDTVYITKYVTKETKRVDTASIQKYLQVVNNAKIVESDEKHKKEINSKQKFITDLQAENTKLREKIASQKKALNISMWALIALGIYTLARIFLRSWIKLP